MSAVLATACGYGAGHCGPTVTTLPHSVPTFPPVFTTGSSLPFTGGDVVALVILGVFLAMLGALLLIIGARRATELSKPLPQTVFVSDPYNEVGFESDEG